MTLINSNDFLDHAKFLIQNDKPNEIMCRSAASRAYYSLFHTTMLILLEKRVNLPKKEIHKFIYEYLYDHDTRIGRLYGAFKDDRIDADYKLGDTKFILTYVKTVVKEIEDLINLINQKYKI